jgi:hypothetical protein
MVSPMPHRWLASGFVPSDRDAQLVTVIRHGPESAREELSMSTVAAYIVVQDKPVTFGNGTISDAHFRFALPDGLNVDDREQAILSFRVNPRGEVTLRARLNTQPILTQTFETDPERVWQEVFQPTGLQAEGNEIVMSVPSESPGKVDVADVVLFLPTSIP